MKTTDNTNPLARLRYHVTGAIERGEATAITGQPKTQNWLEEYAQELEILNARLSAQRDAALAALREVVGLARFSTEWNSSSIKPEPTSFAPMTPLLWHQARAVIAATQGS